MQNESEDYVNFKKWGLVAPMVKLRRVGKEKAVKLNQRKYFKSSGCNLGSNHIWFYTDTDSCVTCTQTTARSLGRKGTDPQLLFEIKYFGVIYRKRPLISNMLIDFKYFKPFKELEVWIIYLKQMNK